MYNRQQYVQMRSKLQKQLPDYPPSKCLQSLRTTLKQLSSSLSDCKSLPKDKQEQYSLMLKQMLWGCDRLEPSWPAPVQAIMESMQMLIIDTDKEIAAINKGSSFICGSGGNPKRMEANLRKLSGYEQVCNVVGAYQKDKLRDKIVDQVVEMMEGQKMQGNMSGVSNAGGTHVGGTHVGGTHVGGGTHVESAATECSYCELYKAVSVCPNAYTAKKLLSQLPNTEWIAGILHQEGTIIDKDIAKAITYYQKAKGKNNTQAIYRLGLLNQKGLWGTPYEYLSLWKQACQRGHLQALTDLGYLYENGLQDEDSKRVILEQDYDTALKYYTRAAQHHFPRALNNLATFYFNNAKYKNHHKCIEYFQSAAALQYVKSLYNLGLLYEQGQLVAQDHSKAKVLFRKSAQKGDLQGKIHHVQLAVEDIISTSDVSDLPRYCREVLAKDETQHQAYYLLGVIYEEGYGVKKSLKHALLYYSVAATEYSNLNALMRLGEFYKSGFGTEQNTTEALRCFEKAWAQQHAHALVPLGEMYEKGYPDLKANHEKAFQYYYQACSRGVPQAYEKLGNMYQLGRGVGRNQEKAAQYYKEGKVLMEKQRKKVTGSSELIQSSYYRR